MNPSVDDPRDFLGFRDYAYKEKHPIGKETYEACGLNDTEKHCVPRFRACKEMKACGLWVQILEDLDVEMRTYVMDLI